MKREVRLIAITTLTLLIYALSIFFDKGAFLFPFPLNQAIILLISIQFAFWNFKSFKIESILMVLFGIFSCLGNEIYWSIFLNYEQMTFFSEAIYTDIFQLISSFFVFTLAFVFSLKQKNNTSSILLVLFSILFIFGITQDSPLFSSLLIFGSYLTMSVSSFLTPKLRPINLFWILLLTLEASKLISIGVNN